MVTISELQKNGEPVVAASSGSVSSPTAGVARGYPSQDTMVSLTVAVPEQSSPPAQARQARASRDTFATVWATLSKIGGYIEKALEVMTTALNYVRGWLSDFYIYCVGETALPADEVTPSIQNEMQKWSNYLSDCDTPYPNETEIAIKITSNKVDADTLLLTKKWDLQASTEHHARFVPEFRRFFDRALHYAADNVGEVTKIELVFTSISNRRQHADAGELASGKIMRFYKADGRHTETNNFYPAHKTEELQRLCTTAMQSAKQA